MKQQATFKGNQRQVWGKLGTILLCLVLLLPITITSCAGALPEEEIQSEVIAPVVEEASIVREVEPVSDPANLAENPELMVAGRYEGVAENEEESGSAFYAANPELLMVDRYAKAPIKVEDLSDSTFFAANPELMAVDRYTTVTKGK